MLKKIFKLGSCLILSLVLGFSYVICEEPQEEKSLSEHWMGIYMEGVKVGYYHAQETVFSERGEKYTRFLSESWTKISRLGGAPVEIKTAQESLFKEDGTPVETVVRTKMSESEIVIKAEVREDKIVFRSGEKEIKEIPYSEKFYLGIPLKEIIQKGNLKSKRKFSFPILDLLSYAIRDSTFEVIAEEDVLILGEKMRLWHVQTELVSIIPVVMDEWIDEQGIVWKSITKASFLTTTSLRMPKNMAVAMSEENLDIAFSTIIRSNVIFEDPQKMKEVTFKLEGISQETIKKIPFDDGSQHLLESKEDYSVIQSVSQIFREEESISFPVKAEEFRINLSSTSFCQANDPEIKTTALEIVGEEQNAWRAAKRIALWVSREMTANYDVGFATAKEILKNKEGDCSEHTVIMVALCRAVGIPARAAVGIMYGDGIFAYHMWPEVYVGRWINLDAKWLATDEETGELYTDATHIKFGRSNLDENIFEEMISAIAEIIGKLDLEIIDFH
ncbi:MAG: transglutaminase-like domain-containing protein [Candidatus Aminicenantaceae bacterium]